MPARPDRALGGVAGRAVPPDAHQGAPEIQLWNGGDGWASGGYIADTRIDGRVVSGLAAAVVHAQLRVGTAGPARSGTWSSSASTARRRRTSRTRRTRWSARPRLIREKPFLYFDAAGNYNVFVPALRTNSSGATWPNGPAAGTSIPLAEFYVAKPGDTAATINAALAQGLNLLFTPGIYHLNQTHQRHPRQHRRTGPRLRDAHPGQRRRRRCSVADVDGVKLAGLLFDAGTTNSPDLLQVGPAGSNANHAANPTSLQDVFFRIGGAHVGKATNSLLVNSNNMIIDHIWAWRGRPRRPASAGPSTPPPTG